MPNALSFLVDPEYWKSVRKTAPNSLANLSKGITAGFLGAPVDIANMALQPIGFGSERPVGGYNQLGRLMGANTNSVPYMVGSMLPISPSDMVHGLPLMAGIFAGKSAKTADLAKLMKTEKKMRAVPVDQQIVRYGDDVARSIPNKTEFEIAHEVAQRNAALPVEQGGLGLPANNTAMDRAKAMGFDTPAYHGTNADIQAFDNSMAGENVQYMKGVFTADNPDLAGNYGDTIYPLLQNKGVTVRDKVAAKRLGLPAPAVDTIYDKNAGILVTENPSNIRSRFAAFDPFQRNSANILAGGAAGGIGINALHDLMNQEEYQ